MKPADGRSVKESGMLTVQRRRVSNNKKKSMQCINIFKCPTRLVVSEMTYWVKLFLSVSWSSQALQFFCMELLFLFWPASPLNQALSLACVPYHCSLQASSLPLFSSERLTLFFILPVCSYLPISKLPWFCSFPEDEKLTIAHILLHTQIPYTMPPFFLLRKETHKSQLLKYVTVSKRAISDIPQLQHKCPSHFITGTP